MRTVGAGSIDAWSAYSFLIGLASLGLATSAASAQSLFGLPLSLPGAAPAPNPQTFLPPDADPNYSTPGGFDKTST